MPVAAIGIGSSLGDREGAVRAAIRSMAELPQSRLVRVSGLYETPPEGGAARNAFLNACAVIETALSPRDLLAELMGVERRWGRVRKRRWSDRTLDLDILLYDELVFEERWLVIPHPEMHRRAFVLIPLAEIAPEWRHPLQKRTVGEMAAGLPAAEAAAVRPL